MATNRDLLKEAIEDARTVKETAIANAKAALEEAFTPYLKEKLSAKLAEIEEAGSEEIVKEEETSEVETSMDEIKETENMAEEISLDELLAELEETDSEEETEKVNEAKKEDEEKEKDEEEMSIEDMSEDDLKSFIEDVIKDMVTAGELEAGHEGEESEEEDIEVEPEKDEEEVEASEEELDEEVDLNELLAELEETDSEEETEELEEAKKKEDEKQKELDEAYATIKTLKTELQEINLLNAKLLYTNKIFRNKSLNESQKIKVLAAFDKATSKKEAQLVYETLLENFKTTNTKTPIKESINPASKILGNVQSKPIIEANDAFARMRELAFKK